MKKLFIIFITLFSINAFAYYTEDLENQCGVINNHFFAVFEVISYTCDAGYFLPADTLGCRPCPTGYTCNGGTFEYNAVQSQGATKTTALLTNDLTNACASNGLHELFAVFEPVSVNLTWNDGVGNTSSTTCTYDGTIALPETPTRPGYVFTGWKVNTNE